MCEREVERSGTEREGGRDCERERESEREREVKPTFNLQCGICDEEIPPLVRIRVPCEHNFCKTCWKM